MEGTKQQVGMFFYHVFLFGGGMFYVLAGLAISGYLSIGFHRYNSKFETVINQINPEVEARQEMYAVAEQQERDSKPLYKSGKR